MYLDWVEIMYFPADGQNNLGASCNFLLRKKIRVELLLKRFLLYFCHAFEQRPSGKHLEAVKTHGVTVALQILVLSVKVRILVGLLPDVQRHCKRRIYNAFFLAF
jgi:hypothetical protein